MSDTTNENGALDTGLMQRCEEMELNDKVAWASFAGNDQLWHAIQDCRNCISVGCNPERYALEAELYLHTLAYRREARAKLASPWTRRPEDTSTLILKAAVGSFVARLGDPAFTKDLPRRHSYEQALAVAETELLTRMRPRDFETYMIGLYEAV